MLSSFFFRFPTMSPLKSLPTRPSWRDDSDLPRLIRWDDYEELPLKENVAPQKSAVLVRKGHERFPPFCGFIEIYGDLKLLSSTFYFLYIQKKTINNSSRFGYFDTPNTDWDTFVFIWMDFRKRIHSLLFPLSFKYSIIGLFYWIAVSLAVNLLFPFLRIHFNKTSDLWNKRHSVAIGDVHECKLIRRREVTSKQVDHIWKSMTITQYVFISHDLHHSCLCFFVVCLAF